MRPDCLRPYASLQANLRHAIQSAVRQKLALRRARRSNRLPQVRARCIGTLRCQCPQPNRAPQAQWWVDTGRAACESFMTKLASSAYSDCSNSYQFDKKLSAPGIALLPTPATAGSWGWQLHRRVQLYRHQSAATCLNGALQARSEFCHSLQALDGAGCPQAKPEGWGSGANSFAYFLVVQHTGRRK